MKFSIGSLVKARGREWVVLPESEEDMLILRPLGGTDEEKSGIYLSLEKVETARFGLPDPSRPGDHRSCRLLHEAVRLGFRWGAGPFRSFARIAVEPRPYQLVPLLMALKLDPIRLLIADDVGIGKTIEAGLIARELLDRGEENSLAVLCPPHLAEQWQMELRDKFHIEAELVLSGTARQLEKNCQMGQSVFDLYPFVIVSLDYIKSDEKRSEFLRACPKLIIVDEAHTCAYGYAGKGGRHQRYQLISGLAANPARHMILVTATPHSGNEEAFRNLISLLKPEFANLPADMTGEEHKTHRRHLAQYFVQRRRGDIRHFMQEDTPFPERAESGKDAEKTYTLGAEYKRFMDRILRHARETVADESGSRFVRRIRWWSALALLRSTASSPAAAAETLRNRADALESEDPEEADQIGRRKTWELLDESSAEGIDVVPGSDISSLLEEDKSLRAKLLEMAREADHLRGEPDRKLWKAVELVAEMIRDGYSPIVFCRFIPTAEYVKDALRERLKGVEIAAVTGILPPAERERRIIELKESGKYVLVATDCLSEGINLQEWFNAVLHYDLAWNPTRHEQREGRVDRFGQPRKKVRVWTYYGIDNRIDGIVLEVLIRKHHSIKASTGVSVPVPADSEDVLEAIFEGLLLREKASAFSDQMELFDDLLRTSAKKFHSGWDSLADREKRSGTMFAQEAIKFDEVARELHSVRNAIGSYVDVKNFSKEVFQACRGIISGNGTMQVDLKEAPRSVKDILDVHLRGKFRFKAKFEKPVEKDELYLVRTHPIIESLAGHVMDTALEGDDESFASRCGVFRTKMVKTRTTMLLLRHRFHIKSGKENDENPLLAEDCQIIGFEGSSSNPQWLESSSVDTLFSASPDANVSTDQARHFLGQALEDFENLLPHLDDSARQRAAEVLEAHTRVRSALKQKGITHSVEPQLPSDVLGIFIYLPAV